jgi:glucose/arabinose dehydrogenase
MRNRIVFLLLTAAALSVFGAMSPLAQDPTATPQVRPTSETTTTPQPTDPGNIAPTPDNSPTAEPTSEPTTDVPAPTAEPEQPTATPEISDPLPTAEGTPVPAGPQPQTMTGNVFNTETRPFTDEMLALLTPAPGFEVSVFARDLGNARMIEVSDTGVIYVSRPATNDVIALFDQNFDGRTDVGGFRIVASGLPLAHGLAIRDDRLYIAGEREIWVAEIMADGMLGQPVVVSSDLPDGDQHARRTLAFGPDGALYAHLGSSCNACVETNPENAVIVRVPLDGSAREIVAEGLRNALAHDWHPETGELWAFDHGTDFRGDDDPPEELNRIQAGNHYGWPFCYGNRQVDRFIPYKTDQLFGVTNEEFCASTAAPELTYQAHSAPIAMLFYTADLFPTDYHGDLLVTMRGSWNRFPATGYKVVRVRFENGLPVAADDFLSGFLIEDGTAHFARLSGLAVGPDGALLVADDTNGVIYRVTYTGS